MASFFRVFTTPGALASIRAPLTSERFAFVSSLNALFAWSPLSAQDADAVNVIAPSAPGLGRWLRVVADNSGASLGDASVSIAVSGGRKRTLPAATLSENREITLATTNAIAGNEIEITRLDVGAFTVAIVNGGPGAGTIATMPVSARSFIACRFDGANWNHLRSGLML
jgi:hypothetical protein